jgi:ABC-type transporter Mla MlaB component
MLRITIHDQPDSVTLQLEGKLVGPWVREVQDCWQRSLASQAKSRCLDLTGVIMIDAAGKAFLAAAHARGAELLACGCLMRAVVAEITNAPLPDCGHL